MEKHPQFIREFSKEESPEERQKTAKNIKAKRAEHFSDKRVKTERQRELQTSAGEREQILAEKLEKISQSEKEIAELSNSMLGKILNYFQLRKLRADVVVGQRTYEELEQQQDAEIAEQQEISGKLDSDEVPPELQEAKKMLAGFYKDQEKKWAKSPYTKEDITKHFSEEHLASLSLQDYALLLQRFPCEMVAHVTRQGIRDHIGMIYHSAGQGDYADGFMKMAEDGRLRSPLGVYLVENEKEKTLAKFLQLDNFDTKEEALKHLSTLTGDQIADSGGYSDRMAVHFATEEVANVFYGSETGNEIFIAYPSAFIASQYYFSGQLNAESGGYWNDQWVWANEEKGMDLNAGLVFIPKEARVDRKTGSRYELDENKKPIKNADYKATLRRVVDSAYFDDFADEVMKITGKMSAGDNLRDYFPKELELFARKLEKEFGITDKRLQFALLDYHSLFGIKSRKGKEGDAFHSVDWEIEAALRKEGILYVEAKDAINSKDFWDDYFAKNPAKKPSKIVYYKGGNPTAALKEWRRDKGVYKTTEDKDIWFKERRVDRKSPQATSGVDRFKVLAQKVIEDYFSQKTTTPDSHELE